MSASILATKLYIPPTRPELVRRPRLIERLNEGLHRKLTLISAPAGFGKTTLVSDWVADGDRLTAWLSLDEGDNDPTRFLNYFMAALQPILAEGGVFQSSPLPPTEAVLTALINRIATIPDKFTLVLDDYHVIDAQSVDKVLTFLIEHLPPQMHLVIATREDPQLPLARLRARSQLVELRAADLRFTPSEAAGFLNQMMGLDLSADDIAALETRTEGWIAGLQLAAISMQGHQDVTNFIKSFTGSHHFVMDYLVEEVLQQQPDNIQTFLLRTSILDRLCGPLCDAILDDSFGQETLEYLERANLFIVPLDSERRWYRYHHLFADLLRQRLRQSGDDVYHRRASQWYEDNGFEIEAFQHAAAAKDMDRATRLLIGKGMPLHFRGAVAPVLHWLGSLPATALDERPVLWVMYASVLSMTGQTAGVEAKLQAAEAALQNAEFNETTRNLIGHIAAIRALLAAAQYQVETVIAQSRRALDYLHPNNLAVRTATIWKLGIAYHLQGDRAAARQSYSEAVAISQSSGNIMITLAGMLGLGNIQELDNQLHLAEQTYRRILQLIGDSPNPTACEAHLGLARISYEWNDLDTAQHHAQLSLQLAQQLENLDRVASCETFWACLKLALDEVEGSAACLMRAETLVHQHHFVYQTPEVAAVRVRLLLRQGNLTAAAELVQAHNLPLSQARVLLAQGDTSAALDILESWRQHVEAKNWQDERLKVMVLESVALYAHGDVDSAVHLLSDALSLAEPEGFIRVFVDEDTAELLSQVTVMPPYVNKLLAAFDTDDHIDLIFAQPLIEPLSDRELEVLHLIAQGLSNQEISERLFLALNTVKGHNQKIFGKLQVERRTEAVARARELGLL